MTGSSTTIRLTLPVTELESMALAGDPTPASGDLIAGAVSHVEPPTGPSA